MYVQQTSDFQTPDCCLTSLDIEEILCIVSGLELPFDTVSCGRLQARDRVLPFDYCFSRRFTRSAMRWSFFSVLYRHNYLREFGTRELSHVSLFNVLGAGQGAGKAPTQEETVFSNRTHLCLTPEVLSPHTSPYGGVFRFDLTAGPSPDSHQHVETGSSREALRGFRVTAGSTAALKRRGCIPLGEPHGAHCGHQRTNAG